MEIKQLGIHDYTKIWLKMKDFTQNRTTQTKDELWLLEHFPVYTQGQAGKPEHVLNPESIPIVQSDRGGQVTYHGPGQLVAYVLMDLNRKHLGVRALVVQLEQILISLLAHYNIEGITRCGAPGVYVAERKIASIGLRVKNGYTYHGIALNVNMDLKPFYGINPCGHAKMEMTQMSHFSPKVSLEEVCKCFIQNFLHQFN
jgi:lipoyl(octanoyl) transferase